jgi:phosphatidylinositol alpha-mannosyltransferase
MKICYVLDDTIYRPAGVQYCILNPATLLAKEGHEITILYAQNDHIKPVPIDPKIKLIKIAQGIDIKGLDLNGSVSTFPGFGNKKLIKKILLENDFDAIHLNYPFSPFISGRVVKLISKLKSQNLINARIVCTLQIHVEERFFPRLTNKALALYFKRKLKCIQEYIHNSNPTRLYGEKYLGVKSTYIPNGVQRVDIGDKLKSNKTKEKINLLFLGRLEDRKGALDLIKALGKLDKSTLSKLEIKIAGDGPERKEAEDMTKDLKLNISFLGRVSDEVRDNLYNEADIAIFPAKYGEAMGVVLLEAMNYGCAIIGYANPGYKDTMDIFADECLVPIEDTKALSEKIKEFADNQDTTRALASKLKAYFDGKYDTEVVGKKLVECYEGE